MRLGGAVPVTCTQPCPPSVPSSPNPWVRSSACTRGARLLPQPRAGFVLSPEPPQTPQSLGRDSAAGASCQERAAVVLLGNELGCLIPARSSSFQLYSSSFQLIPASSHPSEPLTCTGPPSRAGVGQGSTAPLGVPAGDKARLALVSHQLLAACPAPSPEPAQGGARCWEQEISCWSSWGG